MGTRWILEVTCPQCGFVDDDVPFAPTCGFVEWKCPQCGCVVDLYALTGITYDDASNAVEIAEICREIAISHGDCKRFYRRVGDDFVVAGTILGRGDDD